MILPATTPELAWDDVRREPYDHEAWVKTLQTRAMPSTGEWAWLTIGYECGFTFMGLVENTDPGKQWLGCFDPHDPEPYDTSEWYMEEDLMWRFGSDEDWERPGREEW